MQSFDFRIFSSFKLIIYSTFWWIVFDSNSCSSSESLFRFGKGLNLISEFLITSGKRFSISVWFFLWASDMNENLIFEISISNRYSDQNLLIIFRIKYVFFLWLIIFSYFSCFRTTNTNSNINQTFNFEEFSIQDIFVSIRTERRKLSQKFKNAFIAKWNFNSTLDFI